MTAKLYRLHIYLMLKCIAVYDEANFYGIHIPFAQVSDDYFDERLLQNQLQLDIEPEVWDETIHSDAHRLQAGIFKGGIIDRVGKESGRRK